MGGATPSPGPRWMTWWRSSTRKDSPARLDQLQGRQLARGDQIRQLGNREVVELVGHGGGDVLPAPRRRQVGKGSLRARREWASERRPDLSHRRPRKPGGAPPP